MRNVALFGQMYAGKSTIADALTEVGYHRMSFAAPLKNVAALAYGKVDKAAEYEVVREVFPQPTERLWRTDRVSGREILQGVGQTVKAVDRDFWLKAFFRDAANYLDTPLVVDDGRFIFEFKALQENGWLIVGINTNHAVRMQRAVLLTGREPTKAEQEHESEREVPYIIERADVIIQGEADPYYNVRKILEVARAE